MSNESAPQAGAPNVQPTTTEQVQTPKVDEAFAQREKQLRKQQAQLHKQKQDLEAKLRQYETDYIPKSRIKESPWEVLQSEGLDYDKLTEQLLQQPTDPASRAMLAKIKQLEDKQAQEAKRQQDAEAQQYQQTLKQIGNEAKLLIDSDTEFESLKTMGQEGIDAVVELIQTDFEKDGIIKDVRQAALEVENYIIEQGMRFAQLSKVKAKLAPKAPEVTVPGQAKPGMTTISQKVPGTRSSDKDRVARALAAFNGKLNQ